LPSGSDSLGITLGPDGNIWFTDHVADQIDMINPNDATHTINSFGTSDGMTATSGPVGITSADGYLWFTQNLTHQIGRLDPNPGPNFGKITEYAAPAGITILNSEIVLGPDGNLWFTEFGGIAVFDPTIQTPNTPLIIKQTVALPGGSNEQPFGIAVGPDGNIWYTEGMLPGLVSFGVGVINTNTETLIKEIPVSASSLHGITAGPDGNVWLTVNNGGTVTGTIDEINPSSDTITRTLSIPNKIINPVGITAGADGNLWFTDGSGAIGVIADTQLLATAQPPPDVSVNSPFGLAVTDEYTSGVVDKAFNGNVTIALANNPGGSTLAPITVTAGKGVATFPEVTLDKAGSAYTLLATSNASNGPTAVTTSGFNAVIGPAELLMVTIQPPSTVAAGSGFAVTVKDEYVSGPVDTAFNGSVTIALGTNPGGSSSALGGTVTVAAVNGVATFPGLTLNNAGNGYTLQISGNGLTTTTNAFDVTSVIPPPPPTITGEQVVFNQKRNKKGKPIGKPTLAGYTIDFSTAMNQGTIGAPANYVVDIFVLVLQKQGKKKKKVPVPRPIGFTVTNVTSNSVTLKLAGKQKFPKGGQIIVNASPPSGVENTSGVFLAANGTLTISPGGKAIR